MENTDNRKRYYTIYDTTCDSTIAHLSAQDIEGARIETAEFYPAGDIPLGVVIREELDDINSAVHLYQIARPEFNVDKLHLGSTLQDKSIPAEWHEIWDYVQRFYGDVKKRQSEEEFVKMLSEKYPIADKPIANIHLGDEVERFCCEADFKKLELDRKDSDIMIAHRKGWMGAFELLKGAKPDAGKEVEVEGFYKNTPVGTVSDTEVEFAATKWADDFCLSKMNIEWQAAYCGFHAGSKFSAKDRVDIKWLNSVIGAYDPYPLISVLQRLVFATEYLLNKKDYDGHNYEELEQSVRRAIETIAILREAPVTNGSTLDGTSTLNGFADEIIEKVCNHEAVSIPVFDVTEAQKQTLGKYAMRCATGLLHLYFTSLKMNQGWRATLFYNMDGVESKFEFRYVKTEEAGKPYENPYNDIAGYRTGSVISALEEYDKAALALKEAPVDAAWNRMSYAKEVATDKLIEAIREYLK